MELQNTENIFHKWVNESSKASFHFYEEHIMQIRNRKTLENKKIEKMFWLMNLPLNKEQFLSEEFRWMRGSKICEDWYLCQYGKVI
jgi:hypothetical protein